MERPAELGDWVAILPISQLDRAAVIRLEEGARGALDPKSGQVWIRGRHLGHAVFSLPFLSLFQVESATGRLFPLDSGLPVRRLPGALHWEPLSQLVRTEDLRPDFPVDDEFPRGRIQMKRGGDPGKSPSILSVSLPNWVDYASSAPGIRLARLAFAASGEEALIRGTPLPPIPGQSWSEENGIAMPGGWVLDPPIRFAVIRKVVRAGPRVLVLLHPDGTIDRIAEENFVPATRTAARLTVAG